MAELPLASGGLPSTANNGPTPPVSISSNSNSMDWTATTTAAAAIPTQQVVSGPAVTSTTLDAAVSGASTLATAVPTVNALPLANSVPPNVNATSVPMVSNLSIILVNCVLCDYMLPVRFRPRAGKIDMQ